jgi:Icc-related predicted phosphoesterase
MARFLIYSDLHYELGGRFVPPADLRGKVDGIILAGDISGGRYAMRHAREIAEQVEAPAILIAGNHEFYGGVIEDVIDELHALSDDQVRFLECETAVIAGVRILGTTLWTDFNLNPERRAAALSNMNSMLNDYRAIRRRSKTLDTCRIDTDWLLDLHKTYFEWLSRELSTEFDGRTIVVTHTAPSRRSIVLHNSRNVIAAAFASDLEAFVNDHEIAAWVHGHIHDSVDYMIGNTRVVSNPYGYEDDEPNRAFAPDFMIEV